MTQRSWRRLERLAERILPPACAEAVLGDLAETSRTSKQYLRRLLSVLPWVIWSQVRRRVTVGGLIANAFFSGLFLVLFQRVPKEPFLDSPSNWLHLTIVLLVWVSGCALASVYGPPNTPTVSNIRILILAAAGTMATAGVLDVPVVRVLLALAAVIGLSLVMTLPWLTKKTPPPLSLESVDAHAKLFQKMIWWRNLRESLAGVVVLTMNARELFDAHDPLKWTGHALIVAATVFVVGHLYTRAGTRRVPQGVDVALVLRFHRDEIVRQRDVLRTVPLWYLFPLVPGMAVLMASKWSAASASVLVGVPVVLGIFGLVWMLNVWGARFLSKRLEEVDALGRC